MRDVPVTFTSPSSPLHVQVIALVDGREATFHFRSWCRAVDTVLDRSLRVVRVTARAYKPKYDPSLERDGDLAKDGSVRRVGDDLRFEDPTFNGVWGLLDRYNLAELAEK